MGQSITPAQDCFNATVVCQPLITVNGAIVGSGSVLNEIPAGTCLGAGELNSAWYKVAVTANGNLNFTILPFDPDDDYDWAVFNITNTSCSEIALNANLQVGCDFSGSVFPTAATGPNGGSNSQDEPVIPVLAGEEYVIIVSNFSNAAQGYQIDFSASTFPFQAQPVVFNTNVVPVTCQSHNITVLLNQPVECSSISAGDFSLAITANNFPVNLSSVAGLGCDTNGTTSAIQITTVQHLSATEQYTLKRTGSLTSACTGVDNTVNELTFIPIPFEITDLNVLQPACGNAVISPVFNVAPNFCNYTWLLPNGNTLTTPTVTTLTEGTYTVTALSLGCQASYTEDVDGFIIPTPVNLTRSGDTVFAAPAFLSYRWTMHRYQPSNTLIDTTYNPTNYIVLSNYFTGVDYVVTVSVEATNNQGCISYRNIQFTTPVNEIPVNPIKVNTLVTDRLQITSSQPITGTLTISNMLGQSITTQRIENTSNTTLDMGYLPNGFYILTYTNGSQTFSTKIVKVGN